MKEENRYDFELSNSVIHKLEELSYGLQTEVLNKYSMAADRFFLSWSSESQRDFYDCCESVNKSLGKIVSDINYEAEKIKKISQRILLAEEEKTATETNGEL